MKKRQSVWGRGTFLAIFFGTLAYAQNPPVPPIFQNTYDQLQKYVTQFDQQVSKQWNGEKAANVAWSSELSSANSNRGLQVIGPNAFNTTLMELYRLKSLGVKAVTVPLGFPVLYQPFYAFNGDPDDYQKVLDYYKQVANAVHSRGLKLVVESQYLFPGQFSSGSGFNLSGYFPTLSDKDLLAGRIQNIATIIKEIQPDWLNLGSEPDTAAEILGKALPSPAEYAAQFNTLISGIQATGAPKVPMGGGVGTWLRNGLQYVQALCNSNLDFIDLHIYPVNFNFFTNAITFTQAAQSCGKGVGIAEAWLNKESDGELTSSNGQGVASSAKIFARDPFSFWAPLDQAFIQSLVKFSYWKGLLYMSPFWDRYFFGYVDYDSFSNPNPDDPNFQNQVQSAAGRISGTGLTTCVVTGSGQGYSAAVGAAQASTVSAASGLLCGQAPDSLISIYGTNLASGTGQAGGLPLPTSLAGTTVTIQDSAGTQQPMGLIYVGPTQINAAIPPGLAVGAAIVTVSNNGNTVAMSSVVLAATLPGLFTANQTGKGVPIGVVYTARADGSQTNALVFQGSGPGTYTPAPIDLGGPNDQSVLVLYGTGIRGRSSLSNVVVTIGSVRAPVNFAGPSDPGRFVSFDQINIALPKSLAGAGQQDLNLSVDGTAANPVQVAFK